MIIVIILLVVVVVKSLNWVGFVENALYFTSAGCPHRTVSVRRGNWRRRKEVSQCLFCCLTVHPSENAWLTFIVEV